MKIINQVSIFILLFTNLSYSQDANEAKRVQVKIKKETDLINDSVEIKPTSPQSKGIIQPGIGFLTRFGEFGGFHPKIEVIGSKSFYHKNKNGIFSLYGVSKLFSGSHDKNDRRALFVDDASVYGLSVYLNAIPKINIEFLNFFVNCNYLGKTFGYDSIEKANVGVISLGIGLEFILFKDALSFYSNYQGYQIMHGIDGYDELSEIALFEHYHTFKIGMKTAVSVLKDDSGEISIDLTFVRNNESLKRFSETRDWAIPVIKMEFKKRFTF